MRWRSVLVATIFVLGQVATRVEAGPIIPDLQPLDVLAGDWVGDYTIGAGGTSKATSTSRGEWVLDGRFLQTDIVSVMPDGNTMKTRILWGYEPKEQKFTRSMFFSTGGAFHHAGKYDPVTKMFTFSQLDNKTGGSFMATVRVVDQDTLEWSMIFKGDANAQPLPISGTNRRKKD